jgi:hypothetical protein
MKNNELPIAENVSIIADHVYRFILSPRKLKLAKDSLWFRTIGISKKIKGSIEKLFTETRNPDKWDIMVEKEKPVTVSYFKKIGNYKETFYDTEEEPSYHILKLKSNEGNFQISYCENSPIPNDIFIEKINSSGRKEELVGNSIIRTSITT